MKKFFQLTKSLEESGVGSYKELWEKAQADGYKGFTVQMCTVFQKVAEQDNLFHAVFSTESEDRHGEIVFQDWDLKFFKKNNVYLDSHNYDSIEHIIGKVENIVAGKILEGDIVFALSNPKGLLGFNLAKDGFLNTSSVGFIPKQFDDKGNILKAELLEISAVSVPANPEALYEKKEVEKPEEKVEEKEEVVEEKKKINKKALASKAINDMVKEKQNLLKGIARDVKELVDENKQSKKRSIYKSIRILLKQ